MEQKVTAKPIPLSAYGRNVILKQSKTVHNLGVDEEEDKSERDILFLLKTRV